MVLEMHPSVLAVTGPHATQEVMDAVHTHLPKPHDPFLDLVPGGFGEAMLACDLERALYSADTHNRQVFWAVAIWVRQHMPGGSWGSYEAVEAWCRDEDGRRSEFRDTWEKQRVWLTLVK
jgi:hypothetical protein